MAEVLTAEYVVGYGDTDTPVHPHAPVHRSRQSAQAEADARNEANPDGVEYVVLTRKVSAWERAS